MVDLEQGCYSDYTIQSLYFRGNDENEIWNFLCRYIEDIYNKKDYNTIKALIWNDKKYKVEKIENKDWESNWDTDYGDARKVSITRMKVIEFKK